MALEGQRDATLLALRIEKRTPAGVAQWIECRPVNQSITGSDSQSGAHARITGLAPSWGVIEATTH